MYSQHILHQKIPKGQRAQFNQAFDVSEKRTSTKQSSWRPAAHLEGHQIGFPTLAWFLQARMSRGRTVIGSWFFCNESFRQSHRTHFKIQNKNCTATNVFERRQSKSLSTPFISEPQQALRRAKKIIPCKNWTTQAIVKHGHGSTTQQAQLPILTFGVKTSTSQFQPSSSHLYRPVVIIHVRMVRHMF